MAIKREDESRAREYLATIGIAPIGVQERESLSQKHLVSLVLPDMSDEQRASFQQNLPSNLLALKGMIP